MSNPAPNSSTALVPATPVTITPLEPTTLEEAMKLATTFAPAQLLPTHLRNKPADVVITILFGRELGLSPMQAINHVHVIEGKPGLDAQMAVALVKRSQVCEYFILVESSDQVATYETKRRGNPTPTRISFTIQDAQRAELTGKANWKRYPASMLRARASMQLARETYQDIIGGVHDLDELEDYRPAGPGAFIAPPPLSAPTSPPVGRVIDLQAHEAAKAAIQAALAPKVQAQPPQEIVTPTPTPMPPVEREPGDESESPREMMQSRIMGANNVAELEVLVPEIRAMPADDQQQLRAGYGHRMKELQGGAP